MANLKQIDNKQIFVAMGALFLLLFVLAAVKPEWLVFGGVLMGIMGAGLIVLALVKSKDKK